MCKTRDIQEYDGTSVLRMQLFFSAYSNAITGTTPSFIRKSPLHYSLGDTMLYEIVLTIRHISKIFTSLSLEYRRYACSPSRQQLPRQANTRLWHGLQGRMQMHGSSRRTYRIVLEQKKKNTEETAGSSCL